MIGFISSVDNDLESEVNVTFFFNLSLDEDDGGDEIEDVVEEGDICFLSAVSFLIGVSLVKASLESIDNSEKVFGRALSVADGEERGLDIVKTRAEDKVAKSWNN